MMVWLDNSWSLSLLFFGSFCYNDDDVLPMGRLVQVTVSTWQLTVVSLRTLDWAATLA